MIVISITVGGEGVGRRGGDRRRREKEIWWVGGVGYSQPQITPWAQIEFPLFVGGLTGLDL